MQILTTKNIERIKWNILLKISPFSSPFQTPEYFDFYNTLNSFNAEVFAVSENDELLALVVVCVQKEQGIKGYFSRRGIVYGGPIIHPESSESLSLLTKAVVDFYSNKLIYLEIRNYFDYSTLNSQFTSAGFKYIPWLNFHLGVLPAEQMLKSMSSSRSRQIKKAIKQDVSWKEAQSITEVEFFYEILQHLYITRIKKPLFPKQFFLNFFNQKIGKFLIVYFKGKVIGGIMCPIIEGKAIYEFFVCGLDNEYKEQYPSVIATWAAMEYASQNNIPMFDFMGAGSPDEDYGVREFKTRFGGQLIEHGRYLNILNPILYATGKLGLKILSKIT